jgi:hypothetical protein
MLAEGDRPGLQQLPALLELAGVLLLGGEQRVDHRAQGVGPLLVVLRRLRRGAAGRRRLGGRRRLLHGRLRRRLARLLLHRLQAAQLPDSGGGDGPLALQGGGELVLRGGRGGGALRDGRRRVGGAALHVLHRRHSGLVEGVDLRLRGGETGAELIKPRPDLDCDATKNVVAHR